MKVCILTSAHPAFDQRIFHKEARSLVRARYEVTLIAPHERDEQVEGVFVMGVPKSRTRFERMLLTSSRILLRGLRVRAAIYHFHDPELIPVGLFLRLLGKKVIYDIHEYNALSVLCRRWIPSALRPAISKGVLWLDRCAVKTMDGSIVIDEGMAEGFRSAVGPLRSVVVVHNYPELPKITTDDQDRGSEPLGIYVGSLTKDRGLEVLLEAGRRLKRAYPEARLDLLGPLDFAGVRREYAFVDQWRAWGVEYRGVVNHREVPKWLRRARVGLIPLLPTPNYVKATPVKLLEYMLAGLPVVASDFGVMGRIVRETGCGVLVPPEDPDALSRAAEAFLRDPSKSVEMGERGRRAVFERYNWGCEEKKLLALYEELASNRQISAV